MADSVGEPGEQVEDGVGVRGQNVGQVGAVEDVLEGRKDLDPNVWPILDRYEAIGYPVLADGERQEIAVGTGQEANSPTAEEVQQVYPDGHGRQEELSRRGHQTHEQRDDGHGNLDEDGHRRDGERKDHEASQGGVLDVQPAEPMALDGAHAVERVEGALQLGDAGRVPVWLPPWLLGTTPLAPAARGAELLGDGDAEGARPLQVWDVQLGLGLAQERVDVLHCCCCSGGLFRAEGVGEERTSSDPAGGGIGTLGRVGEWARSTAVLETDDAIACSYISWSRTVYGL